MESTFSHQLKLKKPLAFFDLETTGVNLVNDRIVEIGIAKALPDGTVEVKKRLVNPEIPIPIEASLVHGIYDKDVADQPAFKQIARSLAQYLEGCDLGGFNCLKFDIPMLMEEFLRAEVEFEIKNRNLVDAQRIFHLMEPRTLSAAYKFYVGQNIDDLGGRGAHSADIDALATLLVLDKQVVKYEGTEIEMEGKKVAPIKNNIEDLHNITFQKMVDLSGRMAYNAKGDIIFTFGKHKDKLVKDVLKNEPSYYDWFMKGDFTQDSKRRLTEIKLQQKFGS